MLVEAVAAVGTEWLVAGCCEVSVVQVLAPETGTDSDHVLAVYTGHTGLVVLYQFLLAFVRLGKTVTWNDESGSLTTRRAGLWGSGISVTA